VPTQNKSTRQAARTLQTLRGIGKVYAGNQFLCEVRYSVTVHQGIVYAGSQPRAGVTDIKGTLVIIDGERQWKKGTKLSLRMEDGRTADCVTTTGNDAGNTFGIQVSELSHRR
jgi:hypothetical protein